MDQNRELDKSIPISSEFLHSTLDQSTIPAIVTSGLVARAQRRWQHLDPLFQAATREDLFHIIKKLGPIDDENLICRCKQDPTVWLNELKASDRIVSWEHRQGDKICRLWRIRETPPETGTGDDPRSDVARIQRYLQAQGPVTLEMLANELLISKVNLAAALEDLRPQKKVVQGELIAGTKEVHWCDRQNFSHLYRMAVARRRSVQHPADRPAFNRFLLEWHHLSKPGKSLKKLIRRYRGFLFPLYFFEREIFPSRYQDEYSAAIAASLDQFEELISDGEIIVHPGRTHDAGNRYVEFRMRGEGYVLSDPDVLTATVGGLGASAKIIFDFLKENGASYGRDLQWANGLNSEAPNRTLQRLTVLEDIAPPTWEKLTGLFRGYLKLPYPLRPGGRIEIQQINNHPAAASPHTGPLMDSGFEKDDTKLVLWPSALPS